MIRLILIFLVAVIGYLEYFWPISHMGRPMIMGTLTGLVLGDMQTGIMVGATLELVWLGAMAIGASNPPDMTSGSIIGTAYVITTGADIASAVALAVPVSMLMMIFWNFMMAVIIPMLGKKADQYALEGRTKAIDNIHYLAIVIQVIPLAAFTTIGFYVGSEVMQRLVEVIPSFITSGLDYAMGIIPAIGFALLVRMMVSKKTACFLFLGFLLVAYFDLTIVGVTAIACVLTAIILLNGNEAQPAKEAVIDDNEF